MRIAKLCGRVLPVLALGIGTAAAGDPVLPPKPVEPFETPAVVVSTSVEITQSDPKAPTLGPLPTTPAAPGAPVEIGPTPKVVPSSPDKYTVPPMPAPETLVVSEAPNYVLGGLPPQPGLAYARAEYLFWYLSGGNLPVLATTGPATAPIGVPGFPGETAIFGGDRPLQDPRSGVRLTFGSWLNNARTCGFEISGYWLGGQSVDFADGSTDGSRVVASSPFIDANTGLASSVLISFPGVAAGSTSISYKGSSIWGGDALARVLLTSGDGWRLDGLIGYRCFNYNEELFISKTIIPLGPLFVPGTMLHCDDDIDTENEFNGGVLGLDCQKDFGCWNVNIRPSVAIGRMRNTVIRSGYMSASVPGMPDMTFPVGFYNLETNVGEINSQDWTVIPQLDVRLSKTIWECVRLSVGYSAMYIPLLARAGEQIDHRVNPNLIPPVIPGGPPLPAKLLERSDAWLHGFTLGAEVRF